MTGGTIMLMMLAVVLLTQGPRLWQWASESAANRGAAAAVWHVLAWLMSLAFGVWAVRVMWHSIPKGELGWGGLLYLLLAIPVFALGMAVSLAVMLPLIGRIGAGPTLSLALALLAHGLIGPMREESRQEATEQRARDLAAFEHNLEQNRIAMEKTDHAPPGEVPDILEVSKGGWTIDVTNLESRPLRVSVAQVTPYGRQWHRCWLYAEVPECAGGRISCENFVGQPSGRTTDTRPVLRSGQTLGYRLECPKGFEHAKFEFRVSEPQSGKPLFQSDSAFVPDVPDLGG
jgi:hypothetical protein